MEKSFTFVFVTLVLIKRLGSSIINARPQAESKITVEEEEFLISLRDILNNCIQSVKQVGAISCGRKLIRPSKYSLWCLVSIFKLK